MGRHFVLSLGSYRAGPRLGCSCGDEEGGKSAEGPTCDVYIHVLAKSLSTRELQATRFLFNRRSRFTTAVVRCKKLLRVRREFRKQPFEPWSRKFAHGLMPIYYQEGRSESVIQNSDIKG